MAARLLLAGICFAALAAAEDSISLSQAVARAQKEADGVPFHAELETDKGRLQYSIDLAQGKKTCNVVLDAKTGAVVEKEVEDEDHSESVAACKVQLLAVIETAAAQGVPVEAQLHRKAGKPVITVKVKDKADMQFDGVTGALLPPEAPPPPFTDTFRVDAGDWASKGTNPFFVMEPGYVLVLEGGDTRLTITVLDETKTVAGVETRVVEEREEEEGRLVEVSRNYFAISKRTNDVYYFGEDVDIYEDGKIANHEGSWLAGVNGARFGLLMPGTPLLGARYCQEVAPKVAMDRAEVKGLAATVETPAGKFEGCLETEESSALESGKERKFYAPGIGLVREGKLRLAKHGK